MSGELDSPPVVPLGPKPYPGIAVLCLIAEHFGLPVSSVARLKKHDRNDGRLTSSELVRIAGELGLFARMATANWGQLQRIPLPALVQTYEGGHLVLHRVADDKVLVQEPFGRRPFVLTRPEFSLRWSGSLMTFRRADTNRCYAGALSLRRIADGVSVGIRAISRFFSKR